MRNRFTARFVNGVVSACIAVFFLVHGMLGNAWSFGAIGNHLSWLAWMGVFGIGLHVVLSAVTSVGQLNDKERPPSVRKKRHLALKWATGLLIAAVAFVHVAGVRILGLPAETIPIANGVLLAMLALALAIHVCVGMKSLLKDLDIDRRHMRAFRVAVCILAAALALGALLAAATAQLA